MGEAMHTPFAPPLPTDMLLLAYRNGIFPMADSRDDHEVFWVEPKERAIIPLDGLNVSRSLRKIIRQERYHVTVNRDFAAVIHACAQPRPDHPDSWISHRIEASYRQLHAEGAAHSVECWRGDPDGNGPDQGGELVGGLYGVSFDRVFCGESMFSRADNASKVALAWLVALMRRGGYRLLDCQFMTDHLGRMGAVEMPQANYLELVRAAGGEPDAPLPQAYADLMSECATQLSSSLSDEVADEASSPGKRISQSFTHTS